MKNRLNLCIKFIFAVWIVAIIRFVFMANKFANPISEKSENYSIGKYPIILQRDYYTLEELKSKLHVSYQVPRKVNILLAPEQGKVQLPLYLEVSFCRNFSLNIQDGVKLCFNCTVAYDVQGLQGKVDGFLYLNCPSRVSSANIPSICMCHEASVGQSQANRFDSRFDHCEERAAFLR